ncbi:N-acetyl sugar amidotransferase [Simkania negevensis]|uniref:N-acetyl sugar amidotransferase n=1 Tax=Simkania negevensis TaxID=83561 RepID=A0ABS3AR97_9BACT|nr:N-acetyl sugar amidotransferase [Simkania negevensis]
MDTTDPDISFDEKGECNHCTKAIEMVRVLDIGTEERKEQLEQVVASIKQQGKDNRYDCIIGLSGGIDSSYVAYTVKKLGLRPLAIHLDNGWNSELAVNNIEKLVKQLDIDLYTHILDWDEFKNLQAAFLKANVPDGEIPTDHAIVALIYKMAIKENIKTIISGWNTHTESILPRLWAFGHADWRYIKGIQKRFGNRKLKTFPHYNFLQCHLTYPYIRKIRSVRILEYLDYNKEAAMTTLEDELGWQYYGGKHYESIYTRFYQGCLLPEKFNIDKRKAHYSSLICANQMTRNDAIQLLQQPTYDPQKQEEDKLFVQKKLSLSPNEFEKTLNAKCQTHEDYPSYEPLINILRPIYHFAKRKGSFRKKEWF